MVDLFDRCIDAHDEAQEWPFHGVQAGAMAAVFRLIAAEILEHHHRASAREVAQMLLDAAKQEADAEPDDDSDDTSRPTALDAHPSLTAQERNPTLR